MSMSEVLLEGKLMQYIIEFCGMGLLPIVLHTDADVARTFCYKRGVGRMKHLDVTGSSTRVTCLLTVLPQKNCESSFP